MDKLDIEAFKMGQKWMESVSQKINHEEILKVVKNTGTSVRFFLNSAYYWKFARAKWAVLVLNGRVRAVMGKMVGRKPSNLNFSNTFQDKKEIGNSGKFKISSDQWDIIKKQTVLLTKDHMFWKIFGKGVFLLQIALPFSKSKLVATSADPSPLVVEKNVDVWLIENYDREMKLTRSRKN